MKKLEMRRLKSDFEGFGWQCTISGLHVESNNRVNTTALVGGPWAHTPDPEGHSTPTEVTALLWLWDVMHKK